MGTSTVYPSTGGLGSGILAWYDEGLGLACPASSARTYTVTVTPSSGTNLVQKTTLPEANFTNSLSTGETYSWTVIHHFVQH